MAIGKIIFSLSLGLLPLLSLAQQSDSLSQQALQEVTIHAQKPETFAAGSRHTILDSALLSNNLSGTLADILQNRTPIYLKTYGQGQLSTVSFRGTSASHTAVLWNGFSINQPTLGQTDFSLIPLSAVSRVQLQHGSAGSNYGSGAIGGAVLLGSSEKIKAGLRAGMQLETGSFGRFFSELNGSFGTEKLGVDAAVFRSEAGNDFTYKNTAKFGFPEEHLENARTLQTGFTNNLLYRPNGKSRLAFRTWYNRSDIQIQPSMLEANNHGRNQNRNLRLMSEWQQHHHGGTTNIRVGWFNDFMRYSDDATGISDSNVQTWQAQGEHTTSLKSNLILSVGGDLQLFKAEVKDYGREVTEKRASVFGLLRYQPIKRLTLNLNWRQAIIQGFNPAPVPAAGFTLAVLNRTKSLLNWKGSINRGYRVPTLNDRFWPPGNPNLKPENSWNYETGLTYQLHFTENLRFETELTSYLMRVNDWIQWVPGTGGLWAPQNLKKVEAKGLEYSGKLQATINKLEITGGGNFAYTVSEQVGVYANAAELAHKQLVYVPFYTGTAYTDLSCKNWFLNFSWQHTGRRYITAENDKWLQPFGLGSSYIGKNFNLSRSQIRLLFRVNNITNKTYQNLQFYAMPGRNYQLSLRFQFN